jgi:hypothetical protein
MSDITPKPNWKDPNNPAWNEVQEIRQSRGNYDNAMAKLGRTEEERKEDWVSRSLDQRVKEAEEKLFNRGGKEL